MGKSLRSLSGFWQCGDSDPVVLGWCRPGKLTAADLRTRTTSPDTQMAVSSGGCWCEEPSPLLSSPRPSGNMQ